MRPVERSSCMGDEVNVHVAIHDARKTEYGNLPGPSV